MVKVFLERHCQADKEKEFNQALKELRTAGMRQAGYYSGETLRSMDDPSVWLVISTWSNKETWERWQSSPERQEIDGRMEPLLTEPVKVSLFEHAY